MIDKFSINQSIQISLIQNIQIILILIQIFVLIHYTQIFGIFYELGDIIFSHGRFNFLCGKFWLKYFFELLKLYLILIVLQIYQNVYAIKHIIRFLNIKLILTSIQTHIITLNLKKKKFRSTSCIDIFLVIYISYIVQNNGYIASFASINLLQKCDDLKKQWDEEKVAQELRLKAKEELEPQVLKWSQKGTQRNDLRTLICNVHEILWENSNFEKITIGNMLNENQVKKAYLKLIRVVHPDKNQQQNYKIKYLSERIFFEINQAWSDYQNKK